MFDNEDRGIEDHRALYGGTQHFAYLNFGARGLMPHASIEAIKQSLETLQSVSPTSRAGRAWIEYETQATREALAAQIHVDPHDVALTDSVSSACAAAIGSIPWQAGDEVLVCETEPPGTWAALRQAASRFGLRVSSFPPRQAIEEKSWLENFHSALRASTRLVVISHVDWVSGAAVSLRAFAECARNGPSRSIFILVDGAQAVGVLPIDLRGQQIDFYAFGTQKWLCGPDGVAALFVDAHAQSKLAPTLVGWKAVQPSSDGLELQLAERARRFESGSAAYGLYAGVRASLDLHAQFGASTVRFQRIERLARSLREGLGVLANNGSAQVRLIPGSGSGIVSFHVTGRSISRMQRELEELGVIVREHHFHSCLRACVHFFNTFGEVRRLCECVAQLARSESTEKFDEPTNRTVFGNP